MFLNSIILYLSGIVCWMVGMIVLGFYFILEVCLFLVLNLLFLDESGVL